MKFIANQKHFLSLLQNPQYHVQKMIILKQEYTDVIIPGKT